MNKSVVVFSVILGFIIQLCLGVSPCDQNLVCEDCNLASGCTWCGTAPSQGECMSTSLGSSNCTSLAGTWNATCTTCTSAPTANWCLISANTVLTTFSATCVTINSVGYNFTNGTDNCSIAIAQDGPACYAALYSLDCSLFCGPCNALSYDPNNPPLPCKSVCDNIPFQCIRAYARGCLTTYTSLCTNSTNCTSISADPSKFGVRSTTGAGSTINEMTTGTTGTTGDHLTTTGINHRNVSDTNSSSSAPSLFTPSALLFTFTLSVSVSIPAFFVLP